ncbi:MAG TPA: hypothetical protein VM146_07035 [Steroidobacteraceae bacterium]|nr:hypothetical protein [Steroidobacteraceae bacterium]
MAMTRTPAEVADELKKYCATHPRGRDTLEGIAWWLTMQRCNETREVLSAAVDSLVEQKLLTIHRLSDGTTLFGCPGADQP